MSHEIPARTAVLYNADCPLCSFEINHYAAYCRARALPIAFDDLNDAEKLRRWGLSADIAVRQLHVVRDGEVLAGIPAFIALWRDMPRYRWLARLVSLPGIFRLSNWSYDLLLAPLIYRWHLRRTARSMSRS